MKRRFLFVMALAMTSMMACHDDELNDVQREYVSTYMMVKVTGTQLNSTRTLPDKDALGGGTQDGTEEENKISNLMVLLYDKSDVLKKAFVSTVMKNTEDGAQTAIFPMAVGSYKVYVVANFSDREAEWSSVSGFDVKNMVIEDVTQLLMQRNYAKEHQFIMFNQCNGTDQTFGIPIEISSANTAKNPATCMVELDRLAAKIQSHVGVLDITEMKKTLPEDLFKNVSVTFKGLKLLNGAQRAYLQQHWTNKETMNYPYNNTLITPLMTTIVDPVTFNYYSKYSDFRTISLDAEGNYSYVRDNFALMPFYDGKSGPIYCMENNSTWNGTSMVDAMNGNTTGLVYQFLINYEGSDELAGTNCFYAYGNKYFSSLETLQKAFPYVFEKASPSDDALDDLAAAKVELQTAYAADDIYGGIAEFRAKYQVKVYMDGLMYYIYFIKDKNYIAGEKHYYAVMRNTIYDFTIKDLLRVGEDIPGGWNPDTRPTDPVDPTNTYMNVAVKVRPWIMDTEDISLE